MAVGPYVRESRVSTLVADVFKIYVKHFRFFVIAFFLVLAPIWLAWDMALVVFGRNERLWIDFLFGLPYAIASVFMAGVLAIVVHDICVGNRPAVKLAFRRARAYLWPLIVVSFLEIMLIYLGFILLVVPGLILSVLFVFSTSVVVVEQRKGARALRRSRELVRGYFWRVLGVMLIAGGISGLGNFAVALLGPLLFEVVLGTVPSPEMVPFLQDLLMAAVMVVTVPVPTIAIVLLYYDLRSRKEGLDITEIEPVSAAPAMPVLGTA